MRVFVCIVIIDKPGEPKIRMECRCVSHAVAAICEQAGFPVGPCDNPEESLCCVKTEVSRSWWPWA